MSVNASGGSPVAQPQLYRTASISTIMQAEQQDRFLQLGELNQLITFLNSGNKRLEIADALTKNADILVAKAADRIFIGGAATSYLEKPQASFVSSGTGNLKEYTSQELTGDTQVNILNNLTSLFRGGEATPPGFRPINVTRYGSERMKKSLRDLDWFLRYLTYAIVAGDPNILSVNIRGLRELIDNACSSAAASVALRTMRQVALTIFENDKEAKALVLEYFNIVITEFEAPGLTDKLRKREFSDVQGLRLPQVYSQAGSILPKFVMKTSLSSDEKNLVIQACYRQVFERDIRKAYSLSFSVLESQVKNGQLSIKEFIRSLGKSDTYRKQFFEPFVNSRALELGFRHFLGRGPSSLTEFQKLFSILSNRGLAGLVDSLLNLQEYSDYFGEETVPYFRGLGEEAQECRNWGPQINLFKYSAPFRKKPQFLSLFGDYNQKLPDQHPYGRGNDPLLIQFGAIFPKETINSNSHPAPFGKDTRRLLIHKGPGIYNQIGNPNQDFTKIGSLSPVIFQVSGFPCLSKSQQIITDVDAIINGTYLRVFGRQVYQEESLAFKELERQVKEGNMSVREFVRNLAKSSIFRSLYWEPFYICKAIEFIHHRLLGRPTYGRKEINQYFDIVYKQNYYSLIDSILNCKEYVETFGENTVPYERYITSTSLAMRTLRQNVLLTQPLQRQTNKLNQFIKLGQVVEYRSNDNIKKRVQQGVSAKRYQRIIFQQQSNPNKLDLEKILKAVYRQIFERDINSCTVGYELLDIEKAFIAEEITVQQLVEKLGSSSLYVKEFYRPYPNTKVIELGTKHFLGRAPNNQAEIRYYNQILASQGIVKFVNILVNSLEYKSMFGENTVPYRRFPTLPAANFPNTEKLYNNLTKQSTQIIVPSFKPFSINQ
jgi:phycobilisome core-membrane linker protein